MNNLLSLTYRAPYYLFAIKKYIDKLLPVGEYFITRCVVAGGSIL
jgi:hypothetical protein